MNSETGLKRVIYIQTKFSYIKYQVFSGWEM